MYIYILYILFRRLIYIYICIHTYVQWVYGNNNNRNDKENGPSAGVGTRIYDVPAEYVYRYIILYSHIYIYI